MNGRIGIKNLWRTNMMFCVSFKDPLHYLLVITEEVFQYKKYSNSNQNVMEVWTGCA